MSELTTQGRKRIAEGNFALPGRRYPIHDKAHARNALARIAQHGTAAEKKQVQAAVHAKYPNIGDEKTAGMEKEALWPLLIPAAAAALPFMGMLRRNPTGRYNVGGQRFQNYADLEAAVQPGDIIVETPLTGGFGSRAQIDDMLARLTSGHADIAFRDPDTNALSNFFLPMRPKDLRKSFTGEFAGKDAFKTQDFAVLRPKATPEQKANVAKALSNYGSNADLFHLALQTQLDELPQFANNPDKRDQLASLIRLSFTTNPDMASSAANEVFGVGHGVGDRSADPVVQRQTDNLRLVNRDPEALANTVLSKLDLSDPSREKMKPQLEALSKDFCGMGRCSTTPAYITDQYGGGTGINKPLGQIAPRDYLYAKNLEPVGHYIADPHIQTPTSILKDPMFKLRGLMGLGLGGATLAGTGLARMLMPKRVPWHKQLGRSLMRGEYSKAGKALRDGAMLAMKKLGLK